MDIFTSAPCRQSDPEAFFPDRKVDAGTAKNVCAGCPMEAKVACAQLAVETSAMYGVWAGELLTREPYNDDHRVARRNIEALAGMKFRRRPTRHNEALSVDPKPAPKAKPRKPVPARPRCADCTRVLVPSDQRATQGSVRLAARGLCWACYQRDRRMVRA